MIRHRPCFGHKAMLVYEAYRWFRQRRRGSIERERQRACLVVVAFVSAIFVGSGALGVINGALAHYVHTVHAPAQASFVPISLQHR